MRKIIHRVFLLAMLISFIACSESVIENFAGATTEENTFTFHIDSLKVYGDDYGSYLDNQDSLNYWYQIKFSTDVERYFFDSTEVGYCKVDVYPLQNGVRLDYILELYKVQRTMFVEEKGEYVFVNEKLDAVCLENSDACEKALMEFDDYCRQNRGNLGPYDKDLVKNSLHLSCDFEFSKNESVQKIVSNFAEQYQNRCEDIFL